MILLQRSRIRSDWWFLKILRPGLDRIQFYRIRTGLGLQNFTVRSYLAYAYGSSGKMVIAHFGYCRKSSFFKKRAALSLLES